MKPRASFTRALLPCCAMLAIGFALYQAHRGQEIELAVVAAKRRSDELRRQLQRADARLRQAEQESAVRARSAGPAPGTDAAASATAQIQKASAPKNPQHLQSFTKIATNPRLRALYFDRSGDSTLGARFWALHLTPDQLKKIGAIRREQQETLLDALAAAETLGLAAGDSAIEKERRKSVARMNGEIKAVLSPEEYKTYKETEKYGMWWRFADAVASALYLSDTPLTSKQGLQLMDILRENIEKDGIGKWTDPNAGVRPDKITWDAVIARMNQAGFPPAQIAALQTYQVDRQVNELIDATLQRYPGPKRSEISIRTPWLPPALPPKKP